MLVAYTILCWLVFWFCSDIFSNEVSYLKVHYDLEVLPDDRSTLSKYNSDVCKWHLFVSNITEDVFQLLIDIFTLDYSRTLRFQTFDATDAAPQQSEPLPASATDDVLKGFLCTWKEIHKALQMLFTYFTFFVIRCLWEIGSKKSNTNCASSFERLCLSKLPALAPWIPEIYSASS